MTLQMVFWLTIALMKRSLFNVLKGDDDFLFIGQRGAWTSQAIQQIVKKYLRKLGLY